MKVVINRCYGGFGLSEKARKILNVEYDLEFERNRTSPSLIAVVEKLGDEANASFSKLKVVEIPDDVDWYIDDYDGVETIHEKHRIWC